MKADASTNGQKPKPQPIQVLRAIQLEELSQSKVQMAHGDDMSRAYGSEPYSSDRRPKEKSIQSRKEQENKNQISVVENNDETQGFNSDHKMKLSAKISTQTEFKNQLPNESIANVNIPLTSQNPSLVEIKKLKSQNSQRLNSHQSTASNKHKHKHAHEGFDALKIPADWKKAELHAQSRETKPELEEDLEGGGMQPVCECCGYELSRKTVGLMVDIMDLGFLGSGYPLFYNYIKYCCYMLLSLFLIQGIPNIIYNLKGDYCHSSDVEVFESHEHYLETHEANYIIPCPSSNLNKMSMANVISQMKNETNYEFHFSIAAIIVQIALSLLFRRSQRQIESKVDEDNSTPSDFTIMVENISTSLPGTEAGLRGLFGKYGTITKVNLVYDINELEIVEHKIKAAVKRKQEVLIRKQLNFKDPEVIAIDKEIEALEHEEHKVSHEITKTKFIGTAFISYETEQQKKDAIENNPQDGYRRFRSYFSSGKSEKYNHSIYMGDRHLYISEAPEPNDVDWEFAHVMTESKIKSRVISFLKWALLSSVSFAVICGIQYFQSHETEVVLADQLKLETEKEDDPSIEHTADYQSRESDIHSKQILVQALSYIVSTIIVVWNKFALPIIIHKICDHEKWSTKTSMNISFAKKLTIGLFFNTALITFVVEVIWLKNVYAFAGGMIYNEFLVFIFNAVIPSVAWIVDPWKIIQDYKRKKARADKNCVLTQEEANALQENPSYSMGKRYADIMKTMWFTFFYSPVMPIGIPISLLGLIAYYFTDKYNLLFRRTVKESIGPKLSFEMVELVEYSIIFHTFGQVFFKYFTCFYVDVGNAILLLCVIVIVVLVPMQKLNELIFPISSQDDEQKYSEVYLTFDTDYDRENPITKKQAIRLFKEERAQIDSPKVQDPFVQQSDKKQQKNH